MQSVPPPSSSKKVGSPDKQVINLKQMKTKNDRVKTLDFEIFAPEQMSSSSMHSTDSGDIRAHWKKQEIEKQKEAFMMQQGSGVKRADDFVKRPKPNYTKQPNSTSFSGQPG